MKTLLAATALLFAAPALANDVSLRSEVLVERAVTGPDGRVTTKLEPPKTVVPGDRIQVQLRYSNSGATPVADFTVTNPVPPALAFSGTATAGHELSVDAGKTWGQLATLTVPQADGKSRPAQATDVTHIRWILKAPIAPKGAGTLSFGGVVR